MNIQQKILHFFIERKKLIWSLSGGLLVLLLLFNGLGGIQTGCLRNWDESLYGISACEMLDSGNYIVNTTNYIPDYWNLKPILAFYSNLGGMLMFGRNIFGLRFPSFVCFLLTAAELIFFLGRKAGLTAAIAGGIAFAIAPPNWVHCFSTGDSDAVFILFIFTSFVLLWNSRQEGWLLPGAAFSMALAFLTKSFHVAPYVLFSMIWVGVHWKRYQYRHLFCSLAAGLLPIGIWVAARYQADGLKFFQAMLELDLLGRLKSGTACDHGASVWYTYLNRLNHHLLYIPITLIGMSIIAGMHLKGASWLDNRIKPLYCWSAGYFIGIIAIYSCCRVKLEWYIWPVLPFLAILTGLQFQTVCGWFQETVSGCMEKKSLAAVSSLLLGFLIWFAIGEGKAIRIMGKKPPQRDILLSQTGSRKYFGQSFYIVDPEGKPCLPEKSLNLVMRFLSCKIIPGDIETFRQAKDSSLLICAFPRKTDEHTLRIKSEEFAKKHALSLIRCTDLAALYQK